MGSCPSEGRGEPPGKGLVRLLRSRRERRLPTYPQDTDSTPPSTRTGQEAPDNVKFTAFLGTPESWGRRVPTGAPARGESGSTPRPGAEDPGEAQANSLQEFTRAEHGIRRGYKSPEDADVGGTHSHLQDPVDLGGTHRDGQDSHERPLVCGPGVVDQQMPHQWQGSLLPASPLRGTSLRWRGKGRHTVTRGALVKTHCSWGKSHRDPRAPAEK